MASSTYGPFVLGGNVFGWTVAREDAFRVLDAFVDGGGKMIDTADVYPAWAPAGGGGSERILGEWMASRKNRTRVQIATKVAKWTDRPGLSARNIQSAIEGSLERLQTDYVDLYYAHEDDAKVPQLEYMTAFDRVVKEGKARTLGASNFTPERLVSALSLSREQGLAAFAVSQDHWNLVERDVERTLVPVLEKEGLSELPYWSLASGFLTGKYRPGASTESARAGSASKYLGRPYAEKLLATLDEIAAAHRTSVAAVSLAWLRSHRVVGAPIASARTTEQLASLFGSASVVLSEDEVARLSGVTAAR